ncbi:hypothetical protein G7046_g7529 [Stylonectria norvegica]|nr:hypothetical protein G7046_g7529 [Stylonectria norvegica]
MRLLKATSFESPNGLEVVDVNPESIPRYAILSHTWTEQEVLFEDIIANLANQKASYRKVQYACRQAVADGYKYVWVDSCCIDKDSSAEVSEAINSMYEWYQKAGICYAYLPDCPAGVDANNIDSAFAHSRWFTRGWTLLELLAPADLVFFDEKWGKIGEKRTLIKAVSIITGIDQDILSGVCSLESTSIAKRMSWAAYRQTSRREDEAYCLMGIFDVNMSILYGEGAKAFLRLQEEIIKQSDDQSLFAWVDQDASPGSYHGLLAKSSASFAYSNTILPHQESLDWEPTVPYSMSNRGLRIDLHLTRREGDIYVAAINCPTPPDYEDTSFLAIYLKKLSDGGQQFARIKVGQFAKVQHRGNLHEVYVRQNVSSRDHEAEGVFPNQILQLRKGPNINDYRVVKVVEPLKAVSNTFEALTSLRGTPRSWLPSKWPLTYRIRKGEDQVSVSIVFIRVDGERLLVMLGSAGGLEVAFDAVELPVSFKLEGKKSSSEDKSPTFEELQSSFTPTKPGKEIELPYHRVRVDAQPQVHNGAKYYFININVEATMESTRMTRAVKFEYQISLPEDKAAFLLREERLDIKLKKDSRVLMWRRQTTG